MSLPSAALLVAAACCLSACATARDTSLPPTSDSVAAQRQVLIMIRQPPPHFRPDDGYGGTYRDEGGAEGRRRLVLRLGSEYGLELISEWPMPSLAVDCYLMNIAGAQTPAVLIERLGRDRRVESAEPVEIFHTFGHDDPLYPLQPASKLWHLDELHSVATGRQVRVAELDSGVDTMHPDLRGQIVVSQNLVDGTADVAEWHGTAVAGIIAAKPDNGVGIVGIAPGARLMALRACWQENARQASALCSSFTLAKALQFAISGHAEVINMSISGPRDHLLERLLDAALSDGATVVAAIDPHARDGGFPAALPGVIAVADERMEVGREHALRAPGIDIPTSVPGARWEFVSGSSFAAAHVSGLAALLHELRPGITPVQVLDAMEPVQRLHTAGDDPPIIDACAALRRVTGACACACDETREAGLLRAQ
jgi:hypothetical protein